MLDIILTNTTLTYRAALAQRDALPVTSSQGQSRPVGGMSLPRGGQQESRVPELPELKRLAEGLAEYARSVNRELLFRVDEGSGHTVITVLDGETQEVVRQIPNEEFLRLAEVLETARVQLFDAEF